MDVRTARITERTDEVAVHGRFDAHIAPEVKHWTDQQIASGSLRLTVDLSDVTFIDSTALAVLVGAMKRCRLGGGDLLLRDPSATVRVILELTRLDAAFEVQYSNQTGERDHD